MSYDLGLDLRLRQLGRETAPLDFDLWRTIGTPEGYAAEDASSYASPG